MKGKTVYCEMLFWNKLFSILNTHRSPLDDDYEKGECARKMLNAIRRASALKFDDKDEFNKAKREQIFLRKLADRSEYSEGYMDINCDLYQCLPDITSDSLSSLFLSETHVEDAKQKGVMAIDCERSLTDHNLYKDFGKSISKSQKDSWDSVLQVAIHNCNAMLMFDNYLLQNKEENLYRILQTLLPYQLDKDVSFDLGMFTLDRTNNINEEYQSVLEYIVKVRPKLKMNLTIYRCLTSDFHDRAIITNNLWIGCGGGFDLFKIKKGLRGSNAESSKTTTIPMIYPDLQDSTNWATSAYSNFIEDAKKIRKRNFHIGSNVNRLLD